MACSLISMHYAIYGYELASITLMLLSVCISGVTLSSSRVSMRSLMKVISSICILEIAMLLLLNQVPSTLILALFAMTSAISCGCWSLIYQREISENKFTILMLAEMMISFSMITLIVTLFLPSEIAEGFLSSNFILGREGMMQLLYFLVLGPMSAIQIEVYKSVLQRTDSCSSSVKYRRKNVSVVK